MSNRSLKADLLSADLRTLAHTLECDECGMRAPCTEREHRPYVDEDADCTCPTCRLYWEVMRLAKHPEETYTAISELTLWDLLDSATCQKEGADAMCEEVAAQSPYEGGCECDACKAWTRLYMQMSALAACADPESHIIRSLDAIKGGKK